MTELVFVDANVLIYALAVREPAAAYVAAPQPNARHRPRGRPRKGRYAGLTDDEAIALAVKEDDARVRAYARRGRR